MLRMGILAFEKITELREKAGLSQADAARRAGWIPQRWHNIENGSKPNIELDTLAAIAKALGCDPRDLIRPESNDSESHIAVTIAKGTERSRGKAMIEVAGKDWRFIAELPKRPGMTALSSAYRWKAESKSSRSRE